MELKYILDQYGNFALFSPVNTHDKMAQGFYQKPISAGFCTVYPVFRGGAHTEFLVECHGESISLGLKSRPEDSEIITNKLNNTENENN